MSNNQLKRKGEEVKRLAESLEECRKREAEVHTELRESQRRSACAYTQHNTTRGLNSPLKITHINFPGCSEYVQGIEDSEYFWRIILEFTHIYEITQHYIGTY